MFLFEIFIRIGTIIHIARFDPHKVEVCLILI
jgi:hypothetical protein